MRLLHVALQHNDKKAILARKDQLSHPPTHGFIEPLYLISLSQCHIAHESGNQWFSASRVDRWRRIRLPGSCAMGRWGSGFGESMGGGRGPPAAGGAVSRVVPQIIQEPVNLESH